LTTYICTINLFLLFDNTTGMTHLKFVDIFKKDKDINIGLELEKNLELVS